AQHVGAHRRSGVLLERDLARFAGGQIRAADEEVVAGRIGSRRRDPLLQFGPQLVDRHALLPNSMRTPRAMTCPSAGLPAGSVRRRVSTIQVIPERSSTTWNTWNPAIANSGFSQYSPARTYTRTSTASRTS